MIIKIKSMAFLKSFLKYEGDSFGKFFQYFFL